MPNIPNQKLGEQEPDFGDFGAQDFDDMQSIRGDEQLPFASEVIKAVFVEVLNPPIFPFEDTENPEDFICYLK